jgi:hypothetical protein
MKSERRLTLLPVEEIACSISCSAQSSIADLIASAARFAQPVPPKKQELEKQDQQPAKSAESKRKIRRLEAAGSKPLSAG